MVDIDQENLAKVIRNDDNIYEGNLIPYFNALFYDAINSNNPYHNFGHTIDVLLMCYDACLFYQVELTPKQKRYLLISAIFHDFNHQGKGGVDDAINIAGAIKCLKQYIQPKDEAGLVNICDIIKATKFPYGQSSETLPLSAQIIREADISRAIHKEWLQQVVFGLGKESNKFPIEILNQQLKFCSNIKFCTKWAQVRHMQKAVRRRISEIENLLSILKVPVRE